MTCPNISGPFIAIKMGVRRVILTSVDFSLVYFPPATSCGRARFAFWGKDPQIRTPILFYVALFLPAPHVTVS